ncbi:MAG: hypothetical protein VKP62_00145 [Candidatus Sericytochromatia bacterium]|nr:hypothetical protein [Candidatus Sericytochromatia bacterium]
MQSNTLKQASYVALGAGVGAMALSALTFLAGRKDDGGSPRHTGQFIGLWVPTLFMLAEMLDRIAVEDDSFLGVPVERPKRDAQGLRSAAEQLMGRVR